MQHLRTLITIDRFIVDKEREHPGATGELSSILTNLALAAKVVSLEVNKAIDAVRNEQGCRANSVRYLRGNFLVQPTVKALTSMCREHNKISAEFVRVNFYGVADAPSFGTDLLDHSAGTGHVVASRPFI